MSVLTTFRCTKHGKYFVEYRYNCRYHNLAHRIARVFVNYDKHIVAEWEGTRKVGRSVLGPLLFSLYVTPLADIAARYGLRYHCYADDTQLYVSFNSKSSPDVIIRNLEACISSVKCWMQTNMLKLNDEKNGVYCVRLPSF